MKKLFVVLLLTVVPAGTASLDCIWYTLIADTYAFWCATEQQTGVYDGYYCRYLPQIRNTARLICAARDGGRK